MRFGLIMLINVEPNIMQIPANVRTRLYIGDRFQIHDNLVREMIVQNLRNRAFLRASLNLQLLLIAGCDRHHVPVVFRQHDSEYILVSARALILRIQLPSHDHLS